MANNVQLAIVYTPEGGGMPLILGRVLNRSMLMGAIRNAISDAESRAARAAAGSDRMAALGFREQARVLRGLLTGDTEAVPQHVM